MFHELGRHLLRQHVVQTASHVNARQLALLGLGVRAGVDLLHSLLAQTGGDPGLAAAGYYQGLESVRREGELPETEQYVSSVLAQQASFAGE